MNGLIIVISGPSGVGKGTICREILAGNKNAKLSVSCTTRPAREAEREGVDYFFLSDLEFNKLIDEGKLLEWAKYNGYYYGTLREYIDRLPQEGYDILFDIDIQGAVQLKKKGVEAVNIFVLPPCWEELKERLKKRGSETDEEIEKRIERGIEEVKACLLGEEASLYEYLVFNNKVDESVKLISSIIEAEKLKKKRMEKNVMEKLIREVN